MRIFATDFAKRACRAAILLAMPLLLADCAGGGTSYPVAGYTPAGPSYYTVRVRAGDTVSDIAERYHVDQDDIVAMNYLNDRDQIDADREMKIPAYGRLWRERANVSGQKKADESRAAAVKPAQKPSQAKQSQVAQNTSKQEEKPADTDEKFSWPVQGKVISSYGARTSGERNDGINIAAANGTPIKAAQSGTVTYVGNELKGYGNLVLLKHDNGFVTAYAHAERVTVVRGQRIAQGQVIGYAGETGDVSTPQVHFEIRRNTTPVNPAAYLVAMN